MQQSTSIPYTPRVPVEDDRVFKNYHAEIGEIERTLQHPGIAYALVGGPGMAKSSILKRIRRDLLQTSDPEPQPSPALVPLYFKLVPPGPSDPNKLRGLFQWMMDQILREARRNVTDLEFETSRLRVNRSHENKIVDEDFVDFVNDLWELILELERRVGRVKIVLLIDEVGSLSNDRHLCVEFARSLLKLIDPDLVSGRKNLRPYLALVLACDRDLPELLPTEQGRALGAFVRPKYLSLLDDAGSFQLIRDPLREWAGIELPAEVVEEIYLHTGGHPCLIHSIMHELCVSGQLHAMTREVVLKNARSISDRLNDIAQLIQSYITNDPLANRVLAFVYQQPSPLLLEQIVAALPEQFGGSRAFQVEQTLKKLVSLGAVKVVKRDRTKKYSGTGEIFRRWFNMPAKETPRYPSLEIQQFFSVVPTSVLKPADKVPMVINYAITNPTSVSQRIHSTFRIERFSEEWTQELKLLPGETKNCIFRPVFIPEEINKIQTSRDAVLHTEFSLQTEGKEGVNLFKQDHNIVLLPRDTWIWARVDGNRQVHDLTDYIAAWVTPNSPFVEKLQRIAAEYNRLGKGIWGYQGGADLGRRKEVVHAQMEAFYTTLKLNGQLAYVEASLSFNWQEEHMQQRVRLPSKTLELGGGANCIDGAVLFASLIEKSGMNPVIVIIPGHAFVGWETWENSEEYECLETTMIGEHDFLDALAEGNRQYKESFERGDFKRTLFDHRGFAKLLKIKDLRKSGVLPMEAA